MLGINGLEIIVLGIIAVLMVGPERLPEYAARLGQLARGLRRMASGAREQLREEIGPELDDVDWRKLDPRQYDPRRIIREALTDDFENTVKPPRVENPQPAPVTSTSSQAAAPQSPQVPTEPGHMHSVLPDVTEPAERPSHTGLQDPLDRKGATGQKTGRLEE